MDQEYIDECRAQAREHRGVWYDVRADKFAAEVYSKGNRHFLGHFATAEEAGDAYAAARAELPSGRSGGGTFAQAFQDFLDNANRDQRGSPLPDEAMCYKDQDFYFKGVEFRFMNKRKRPFYVWNSSCCDCGSPYTTMTATSPAGAKGITRRCEAHRVGYRPAVKQSGRAAPKETDVPQVWIDKVRDAAETLSLIDDAIDPFALVKECWGAGGQPEGFIMFVTKSPRSPVFMKDGKFFLRNT